MNTETEPLTETTADGVRAVIAEQLGVPLANVKPEAKLIEDLATDSLDTVELVIALEDEFNIEIADEDWELMTTVQDAIDLVNRYVIRAVTPKRHGVPA